MPIMPAFRNLGKEDSWKFGAGLGYIASTRPAMTK